MKYEAPYTCVHADGALCETCFKYEQQLAQLQAKDDYIKLQFPTRERMRQEIAQLQEENAKLKSSNAMLESAVLGANQMHQGYDKEIAQLQLEVGRAIDFIKELKDGFEIINMPLSVKVCEEFLSQPTPLLYSAVVELVEALDDENIVDIKPKLFTLKKLMGRA